MEDNRKYKFKESLTTLDIDKSLLESVEDYIFNKMPPLIDIPKSTIKDDYAITIINVDTELTLKSIDSYEHEMLPNGVTEIQVKFRSRNSEKNVIADFRIVFSSNRFSSKIELELTSPNPKEIASGVLVKFKEIFDQKKNHNYLFQPSLKLYPFLLILILGMGYLSKYVYNTSTKWGVVDMLFNLLLVSYLFLFSKWKPYMSFDTRRQRTYDKWANFFLWGTLGAILFGICLPKIFDYLASK